jgi:hypothetical protein
MERGIGIERSDEQLEKANFPTAESLQPDSSTSIESIVQLWKQALEIVSMDCGIEID